MAHAASDDLFVDVAVGVLGENHSQNTVVKI